MADSTTVFVSGKVYWAKILGAPRMNYEGTGKEWTYEFEPDDTTFLKDHKLLDRLKNKYEDRGPFINLRKPELDTEGNKNEPIRVYDNDKHLWDGRLLGNGTGVDLKLRIVDWGKGKKKSIYTTAMRVTDLVPYESDEFSAMDNDQPAKETKAKPKSAPKVENQTDVFDSDLDDDLPFE